MTIKENKGGSFRAFYFKRLLEKVPVEEKGKGVIGTQDTNPHHSYTPAQPTNKL